MNKRMLPICDICAKTGVLCTACQTKLEKNEITDLDVKLSKIIYSLGRGEFGFYKSIDTDKAIIIFTKKSEDVPKLIGKGGVNIRTLSNKMRKPVRIIGTDNLSKMLYDFFTPINVLGINKVFKSDGTVVKRVVISEKDRKKMKMDIEPVERMINMITGENISIVFE